MPDDAVLDAEMFTAERQLKAAHEELTAAEDAWRRLLGQTGGTRARDREGPAKRVQAARAAYAAAFAALQKAEGTAL